MKVQKSESIGTRDLYMNKKVCLKCKKAQSVKREFCFQKLCRGPLRYRK